MVDVGRSEKRVVKGVKRMVRSSVSPTANPAQHLCKQWCLQGENLAELATCSWQSSTARRNSHNLANCHL